MKRVAIPNRISNQFKFSRLKQVPLHYSYNQKPRWTTSNFSLLGVPTRLSSRGFSSYKDITLPEMQKIYQKTISEKGVHAAINVLQQMLKDKPKSPDIAYTLIDHLIQTNQMEEAEKVLNDQVSEEKDEHTALLIKAATFHKMGKYQEALHCAEHAEQLGHKELQHRVEVLHLKSQILSKLRQYEAATESIEKALQLEPQNTKLTIDLLRLLLYQEKQDVATDIFVDFMKSRSEDAEVQFSQEFELAKLAYALGFRDDALASLLAMLEFPEGKQDGDIEFEAAKFFWQAEEKDKALELLRNVANRRPLDLLHWYAYGCALDDMDKKTEATGVLSDIQDYLINSTDSGTDLYLYRVSSRLAKRLVNQEELSPEELRRYQDAKSALSRLSTKQFHDYPWHTVVV